MRSEFSGRKEENDQLGIGEKWTKLTNEAVRYKRITENPLSFVKAPKIKHNTDENINPFTGKELTGNQEIVFLSSFHKQFYSHDIVGLNFKRILKKKWCRSKKAV